MKTKYLIVAILSIFLFISPTKAEQCDSDDIARLKNLAEHVDVSYTIMNAFTVTYYEEEPITYKDRYKIQLLNLTNEIYGLIKEGNYQRNFTAENPVLEQVSPGSIEITIYSSNCGKKLKTINLLLPYYNYNYNEEECKNLDIEVCKEWTLNYISRDKYQREIEKMHQNDSKIKTTIKDILKNNITYIIFGTIIFIFIITAMVTIINKKRSELK